MSAALICLALNIYFEARGEPTLFSMAAPAHVVLNRVKDERYPNDICSVVKQAKTYPNGFPIKNKCQFSWYCDGRSDKPLDKNAFNFSFLIAKLVLTGRIEDVTHGATHYHADYVNPQSAIVKTLTAKIRSHLFYRWERS